MTHERLAISCPECSRKYAVPAGSIGPEGRTVRCVSCHHSWIALPEDVKPVTPRPADPTPGHEADAAIEPPSAETPAPVVSPPDDPKLSTETASIVDEAPLIDTALVGGDIPHVDAPASHETHDEAYAPTVEDEATAMPGRRRFKVVAALGGLIALAAAGGAGLVLSGQIAPRDAGSPVLTIRIPDRPVRQVSADGQEVITTTAEVVNGGTAPGRVPELKATMRTPDGRIVKEWRVAPPPGEIAPRGSRSVQVGTTGTQVPKGPLTLDVDMVERDRR